MMEQLRQIACKKLGGVFHCDARRLSVSATIVGEQMCASRKLRNNAVPNAAIECERMDKRDAWRFGLRRRMQRIRDVAPVQCFKP